MTITGGTQVISVVLSITRMKALALLLGPAGVGVLSIYNNFQSTAGALAGLGIGDSGVRQIAQSKADLREVERVRRVLFAANLIQGSVAMAIVWFLRVPIAAWLFDGPGYGNPVGLVGIAILLNLMSASQTALLRGLRRIGDLGRVTVLGALAGTVVGITAIWFLGMNGLIWLVLAQPLTAVSVAAYFTRKLPKAPDVGKVPPREIWRIWKPMVQLGVGFMIGGLAISVALLFVRVMITDELGLDAAGQFAAAWAITTTYVGFLLNAMSMDYYPRLAEVIHDKKTASRLMNEQMQIGLLIGGPILLLLIGCAPIVMRLLYSGEFDKATSLLQWQMLGNLFKLATWSMSLSVVAAARTKAYLFMQASFLVPFLTLIYFFLPIYGIEAAGFAFFVSYVIFFAVAMALSRSIAGFRFEPLSLKLMLVNAALSLVVLSLALTTSLWGIVSAIVSSVACGFVGAHILLEKIGRSRYTEPLSRLYAFCGWPVSNPE